MQAHEQEKILVKRGELAQDLDRLNAYIEDVEWHRLPEADRALVIEERNHTAALLGVLQLRAARFLNA
jgi:predicted sulfurtransferase